MECIEEVNMIRLENKDKEIVSMTPVQIYDMVMSYSQNPSFEWKFSITELYRVISMDEFPIRYAKEIQIAIIDYFSTLELNEKFHATKGEQEVVNAIYNRFVLAEDGDKDSLMVETRKGYLASIIEKSTMLGVSEQNPSMIKFDEFKNAWRETEFKTYENIYGINFTYLLEVLIKDFRKYIKTLQGNGSLVTGDKTFILESKIGNKK